MNFGQRPDMFAKADDARHQQSGSKQSQVGERGEFQQEGGVHGDFRLRR
jgi:hypothetical protein